MGELISFIETKIKSYFRGFKNLFYRIFILFVEGIIYMKKHYIRLFIFIFLAGIYFFIKIGGQSSKSNFLDKPKTLTAEVTLNHGASEKLESTFAQINYWISTGNYEKLSKEFNTTKEIVKSIASFELIPNYKSRELELIMAKLRESNDLIKIDDKYISKELIKLYETLVDFDMYSDLMSNFTIVVNINGNFDSDFSIILNYFESTLNNDKVLIKNKEDFLTIAKQKMHFLDERFKLLKFTVYNNTEGNKSTVIVSNDNTARLDKVHEIIGYLEVEKELLQKQILENNYIIRLNTTFTHSLDKNSKEVISFLEYPLTVLIIKLIGLYAMIEILINLVIFIGKYDKSKTK